MEIRMLQYNLFLITLKIWGEYMSLDSEWRRYIFIVIYSENYSRKVRKKNYICTTGWEWSNFEYLL